MRGWPWLIVAGVLSGCVAYQPRPIEPAKVEAEFDARGLSDPGLRAFLEANLPEGRPVPPPDQLDPAAAMLVAFYYHPDLDVARARLGVAEASVITAGARPNPGITLSPEYNADALTGVSPWIFGFSFGVPVETAGKRGYRIEHARRLSAAARLDLAETAWRVRSRVRAALLEHLVAREKLSLLEVEERVRSESVSVMEKRLAAGDVSRPEVDAARAELAGTGLAARSAAARVAESLAALASALGLPVSAIEGARLVWPELLEPPGGEALSPPGLRRLGLINRADVRRALAEYAAAEALLQLEVARQYPDIRLGPGYSWDQGASKFSVGLSITLPVFNANEGPIAEAEARREEMAARFQALQSAVISEIDGGLRRYLGALSEVTQAESVLRALLERERAVGRALELGEADRLALVGTKLERTLAARGRLDSLKRVQAALGALEDAVQQPLGGGPAAPGPPPTIPPTRP